MPEVRGDGTAVDPLAGFDLGPLIWSSGVTVAGIVDGAGLLVETNSTFRRLAGRQTIGERLVAFLGEGQADAFLAWLTEAGLEWTTRTWGMLPGAARVPRDIRLSVSCGIDGRFAFVGEPVSEEDLATGLLDVNRTLIVEHRRIERERERLDRVTRQDALTGVANRRAFDERLTGEVGLAAAGGRFALAMLDIDHFKAVNDTYGHPTGDVVLAWLGGHLRGAARRGDLVARFGGEEFVAILADADASDAGRWCERLREAIRLDPAPGLDPPVTVSLGATAWRTGDSARDVVARVDRALYAAKAGGRDRVVVDAPMPTAS